MKRFIIISVIVLSFFTLIFNAYGKETAENERSETSNTEISLTLQEAIEIAQKVARKWNKEARLYFGISVDKDKTQTGMNG
ncbi:hypothetical protein EU245_15360, partial [Lentibacillus lipolyticus]